MGFGIGERQGRAPGAAEQHPALDAEMVAESFHVRDQVPGGVVLKACVRCRAPGAALIEEHDAPDLGVEVTPVIMLATGARAAMHEQHRQTLGVAAFLDVERVWCLDREAVRAYGSISERACTRSQNASASTCK